LYESGEHAQAREIFEYLIQHPAENADAIKAARMLPSCCKILEVNAADVVRLYQTISDRYIRSEDEIERCLALVLRRMIPSIYIVFNDYEAAMDYNRQAINDSPFEQERILAEIQNIDLDLRHNFRDRRDRHRLNAINSRHGNLFEQLQKAQGTVDSEQLPTEFSLESAFPNPFNSTTNISYSVPKLSHVKVKVYDLSGRLVKTLVDRSQSAGVHSAIWDAAGVASGIYLVRMEAPGFVHSNKLTLVK